MPMQYLPLPRWILTIGLLFLFFLPKAHSRSITLAESLQHALSHNETLQIANEDQYKSQQQIRQAAAAAFPQFDLTLRYTRNWLLPSFFFDTPQGQQQFTVGAHNNLISTVGIRQPIYSGGKTFAALRIARMFERFSNEVVRAARQRVYAQTEATFYDLLLAEELTRVSKSSVERARTNFQRVQKLRRAGRVSDYDLLRAQVQVAEQITDSIRTQNARELAALTFKNQIGIDPNESLTPQGTFRSTTLLSIEAGESSLIAQSLKQRPVMRQQQLEVEMRHQAERVSQASSRPTLDLIVNGQWEAQKNTFNFSRSDFRQSWFSGVTLKIPLFDGFRTRALVSQARSDTKRARLAQKQIERDVRLNVMQSLRNYLEASARKKAQVQSVTLAQKGMQIAESRYEGGVGTQLEIIDAQLTLQRAEAEFARAQRDLAIALVYLEQSTGILGEPAANKDNQ